MLQNIEQLPLLAAGSGAVIGAAMDLVAQHKLSAERQAFVEAYEPDNLNVAPVPSFGRKVGRTVVGSLFIYTAAAGYINGEAWADGSKAKSIPPSIEVVVDHSGATMIGEKPAINSINAIVQELATSDLTSHAFVARLGDVRGMETDKVSKDKPFGDAPLMQGIQSAIDTISVQRSEAIGDATLPNVGIVAITNGNSLGDPIALSRRAIDTATPISIVNVESSVQDPDVEKQLKAITEVTGGNYWNIDAVDGTKVAKEIAKDLVRQQAPDNGKDNGLQKKLFGLAALAGIPFIYRNRRNEPITNSLKGKGDK